MKLLYIPLDERPCNAIYPVETAEISNNVEIITPARKSLGYKKKAADIEEIWLFIEENIANCDAFIFSVEMVLYGGLVPSRLHYQNETDIQAYRARIIKIKEENPKIPFYAFNLIMRTPRYNSNDEEPDYYEQYGEAIFRYGWLTDLSARKRLDAIEKREYEELKMMIPKKYISDYENRRHYNQAVNKVNIELVGKKIFEFMIIPQDDSAEYGYTAMDQKEIYSLISSKNLKEKILIYPGADEVGFTLLARAYNQLKRQKPKVFIKYASTLGETIIPLYEDRIINETLKAHIMACGCKLTDKIEDQDFILMYNTPGKVMQESWDQYQNKDLTYDTYRHLLTFVQKIGEYIDRGYRIGIVDSAYANGGDFELIQELGNKQLLSKIFSYKAWNTNGNSLGSAIGTMVFSSSKEINIEKNQALLFKNYLDDFIYQSKVRDEITRKTLPTMGLSYFDLFDQSDQVGELVKRDIEKMAQEMLPDLFLKNFTVSKIEFPWNRMFEINILLTKKER